MTAEPSLHAGERSLATPAEKYDSVLWKVRNPASRPRCRALSPGRDAAPATVVVMNDIWSDPSEP